jgi:hypothetical protein
MSSSVYIMFAFFLPFLIIGGSIPVVMWMARNKNEAFARNHVQICVLSDSMDKKYYQADEPKNGAITTINFKRKTISGVETKELDGRTYLAMRFHPASYPPAAWRQIRAPISEAYVTDSFVPFSLERTDPLEVASALFRLEHEGITAIVVKQAHLDADKEKKKDQNTGSKSTLQILLLVGVLSIVVGGITIYMVMKGNTAIMDILNGLKTLGVIR